ncbi:hypothetical protein D3C77_387610 [compost metagenome]
MLYIWFKDLNPLFPTLVLGPLGSILVGFLCKKFKVNIFIGLIVPILLPLLFTAQSISKMISYIDVWILYGCFYILIALITYKLSSVKNSLQ